MEELEDLEAGGLPEFARDPFGVIRRRWDWMLLALTAGLAGTAAVVMLSEPQYRAEATVIMSTQQIPEAYVQSSAGGNGLERMNSVIGKILSRAQLARLIERFDLYPEMRKTATLSEVVDEARENIEIAAKTTTRGWAQKQNSQLIGISFHASRPETAAAVANEIAEVFTNESVRLRSQQSLLTAEFLRAELERTERELTEQTHAIRKFKEDFRGDLPEDLPANLARLEALRQQQNALRVEVREAENQLAIASLALHAKDISSPLARLDAMRATLEQEMARHTSAHPNVILMQREIAAYEEQIRPEELKSARARSLPIAFAKRSLEDLRAKIAEGETLIAEIDARLARFPARQQELSALLEREGVLREQHLEFLRNVQDAELALELESAQQGERLSILDRAEPPSEPTRYRWKYLVVGVAGSFLVALAIGVLRESIDPVFITSRQLEASMGLKVLGMVETIS